MRKHETGTHRPLPPHPARGRTPEQRWYEGIRSVVLFGLTIQVRAEETGAELRQRNPARWDSLRGWAFLQQHMDKEAITLLEKTVEAWFLCLLAHSRWQER